MWVLSLFLIMGTVATTKSFLGLPGAFQVSCSHQGPWTSQGATTVARAQGHLEVPAERTRELARVVALARGDHQSHQPASRQG